MPIPSEKTRGFLSLWFFKCQSHALVFRQKMHYNEGN